MGTLIVLATACSTASWASTAQLRLGRHLGGDYGGWVLRADAVAHQQGWTARSPCMLVPQHHHNSSGSAVRSACDRSRRAVAGNGACDSQLCGRPRQRMICRQQGQHRSVGLNLTLALVAEQLLGHVRLPYRVRDLEADGDRGRGDGAEGTLAVGRLLHRLDPSRSPWRSSGSRARARPPCAAERRHRS